MANERFTQKAVAALAAYFSANLAGRLRAIESEQSLANGAIPDPTVVAARVPFDNRLPLLEIYETAWAPHGPPREKVWNVECELVLSYGSDADIEAGEQMLRRYETAILKTLEHGDWTLGGTVPTAYPTDGASGVVHGDQSTTRMIFTQGVIVRVHDS